MDPFSLSDGTAVTVDGMLDPSLPLVVLLHGMGGSSLDMTAPGDAYLGMSFNRNASFPLYRDEGIHLYPSVVPVARTFLDPMRPATSLTSWTDALTAAGFSTLTYNQQGASVAGDVTQLGKLVTEALIGKPALSGLRVAFVAHSRGGIVARSFLAGAGATPALAGFLPRVTSLITLHSPHQGSGLAGAAVAIDAQLARVQGAVAATIGGPAPAILGTMRGFVLNPARAELAPGSPTLTAIAAAEPVAGIAYHTFGGNSTDFARLWASVYTPEGTVPFWVPFVPFPFFHWSSVPVPIGTLLNFVSFAPAALAVPLPVVTEMLATLATLAIGLPEIVPGAGDLLVADARAHLPFSASRTTNPLNHLEALSDTGLQAQVIAILARLRSATVSGRATARLNPYPATKGHSKQYTVAARDAVTGAALTPLTVTVRDTFNHVLVTAMGATPFTVNFTARTVRTFDGESHEWDTERLYPTVDVNLGPPYGSVPVDTGLV